MLRNLIVLGGSTFFFQAIGKAVQAMVAWIIRDMLCFVAFTIVLCNVLEMSGKM